MFCFITLRYGGVYYVFTTDLIWFWIWGCTTLAADLLRGFVIAWIANSDIYVLQELFALFVLSWVCDMLGILIDVAKVTLWVAQLRFLKPTKCFYVRTTCGVL
eukprot:gene3537-2488_t